MNNTAQGNNTDQPPTLSSASLTRSVQENLAIGTKVGNPLEGTDPEGLTITYSRTFGIGSYSYFAIDSTTGQLSTSQVLDYEAKTSHTIQVSVNDPSGNSNSYEITINVINDTSDDNSTNRAPTFIEGDSTTRNIIAGDPNSLYLGSPILATDPDGGTLYYVIIDDPSGFLYMGNPGWEVRDGDPITVRHEIPQVKHQLPPALRIVGDTYTAKLTVWDDQNASDSIQITINVVAENSPPVFLEGSSATRSIKENTGASIDIGTPIYAIDCEDKTITYSLGGTDASSFSINTNTGQLQTRAALDYETKNTYTVTVHVSDGNGGSDSITVTINVTDVNEVVPNNPPMFSEGISTTRSIAENTPSGRNIGGAVTATDADSGNTLTYNLSGTDAASFSIVTTSGQLRTATSLDYETKSTYTVTVNVSDGKGGSDSITVTINVTDVNDSPMFSDGASTTRSIAENTPSGRNIGGAVTATDADTGDTLTYSLGGTDAALFSIVTTSGQLRTAAALDYETKRTYTVTVNVSDGSGGSDSISVTINVADINDPPMFSDGTSTTRTVAENTPSGTNIGKPVSATDADTGDTLTYSLGGTDAALFSIVTTSGQLRTAAALDYETKRTYTVTVNVSDGSGGSDSISVTINVADINDPPLFSDGTSTTRSVAENTASGTNIGSPVTATDPDGDPLTYSLGGTDAAAFSIDSSTGQLRTAAALDYETKKVYSLTITATDASGATTNIDVIINVTDVDETVTPPPVQPELQLDPQAQQSQPNPQTDPQAQQSQPNPQTDPQAQQSQPQSNPQPEPEPQPEPNWTIIPFDYEKEGVGRIVVSEIMLSQRNKDVQRDDLPQWIELYNTTNQDIEINGWKIVGRYLDDSNTINILESQVISTHLTVKSKGTFLIVSYATSNSRDRISTGLADKAVALGSDIKNLWNYEGLVLELQDAEGNPIDRIGNLNEQNEIVWEIPSIVRDGRVKNERVSLVRRLKTIGSQEYNFAFGIKKFGWFPANEVQRLDKGRSQYYYGRYTDTGSPGYRTEGGKILPVTLSSFNPRANQDGLVVISWITESEVDNAGFNIFRSEKPQGPFVKVNPKLIQGAGTTGERSAYTWEDTTAKPNIEYYYQIEDVSFAGVKETLVTQRLKGIHTAKNRALTSWGIIKQDSNK